jgi:hypothetical protein
MAKVVPDTFHPEARAFSPLYEANKLSFPRAVLLCAAWIAETSSSQAGTQKPGDSGGPGGGTLRLCWPSW